MLIERYMTRDKIFINETLQMSKTAVGRKYATFMPIASHLMHKAFEKFENNE